MNQQLITFVAVAITNLLFIAPSSAALLNIGTAGFSGSNHQYNLIYDNDSPFGSIVWLDFTHHTDDNYLSSYGSQQSWASGLNQPGTITYNINSEYSVDWKGDWRLPITAGGPLVMGFDGSTTAGYNITSSEMGHLYYSELNNKGYRDINNNVPSDWGLANTGSFEHLYAAWYWSKTGSTDNPGLESWYFHFGQGRQGTETRGNPNIFGIAVRPVEVTEAYPPVPEPNTMLLFGTGLICLAAMGRRKAN